MRAGLATLDTLENEDLGAPLKAAPPLIVTAEQLDVFVSAFREVVELAETSPAFCSEALGMARLTANV